MWLIISNIATVVIAVYAVLSYKLSQELKKANDENQKRETEFKGQVKDLYQAIVISNLLSGPSSYGAFGQCVNTFKNNYKGKVKIFD